MEKKEKILLTSTCGLGVVSIVFISLFAWKAATSGGGDVPPEPVDHVKVNFTTEGCKVYKDNKTVTTDNAIKNAYQTYTIKLDDEYKQDYDLSEYSLKVYTLNGEEYDSTRYTFNYKAGILSINPSEEVNVKCRATLACDILDCVITESLLEDTEPMSLVFNGVNPFYGFIDWGDGEIVKYVHIAAVEHHYNNPSRFNIGDEFQVKIYGNNCFSALTQYGSVLPEWVKGISISHKTTAFPNVTNITKKNSILEKVYIEDGVKAITTGFIWYEENLTSIRLPSTLEFLSSFTSNVPSIPSGKPLLDINDLPKSLKYLGSINQNTVIFGENITEIDFSYLTNLTHLSATFNFNQSVTKIKLPANIENMRANCFNKLASLSENPLKLLDLSLLNQVPSLYDFNLREIQDPFENEDRNENLKIIVKKGMINEYKNDPTWKAVDEARSENSLNSIVDCLVEAE